ncbi:hypothetical protein DBR43_09965 [Pedobacter sp. KBW06]|uniref:sensor histidine kinase n=1 Tax=Pedobacter sp. KBW06 TaxID=2153359 RepID=UPI000F5AD0C7|nr:histidine kinase [Pedobacter sp. KBW06]RQO75653.1 hypothetical protein DBR43_09965 [Pedobacter sp. KBW06]
MTSGNVPILLNHRLYKFILIVVVTFVLIFSMMIINPLNEFDNILKLELTWDTIMDIIWFMAMGWSITECSLFISYHLDRLLPWELFSGKRFFIQLFAQCICVMGMMTLLMALTNILIALDNKPVEDDWVAFRQMLLISVILSLIISAIHTGNHLIENWKNSIIEAADLKQATLQSQLQTLKLQLDPHFMFNNFSTLSSLISENQKDAQRFLERLSEVHRYMLANLDKNIIPLKDELSFIESYIYLIKIRFSENLQIQVNDVKQYFYTGIPPTTLQLLVENAVKHNIASRHTPLYIRIYPEDDYLVVANNIQPIPHPIFSSKIGLKNINNRYKLLSQKLPVVIETEFDFVVKVPLLPLNSLEDESINYRRRTT